MIQTSVPAGALGTRSSSSNWVQPPQQGRTVKNAAQKWLVILGNALHSWCSVLQGIGSRSALLSYRFWHFPGIARYSKKRTAFLVQFATRHYLPVTAAVTQSSALPRNSSIFQEMHWVPGAACYRASISVHCWRHTYFSVFTAMTNRWPIFIISTLFPDGMTTARGHWNIIDGGPLGINHH